MLLSELEPYLPELLTSRQGVGVLALHARPGLAPQLHSYGRMKPPFSADSLFEIGSLTKLFTAALLARLVAAGKIALDQPVSNYLALAPDSTTNVTVLDLATHHAGLPRLPSGMDRLSLDPYAGYTRQKLLAWLLKTPMRASGTSDFLYSNLGYALLGAVLEAAGGWTYAELLTQHVLQPLGLSSTGVALDRQQQTRLVQGHHLSGRRATAWHWDAFAPCGGLKSSAADLLTFAGAFLTDPVLAGTLKPRAKVPGGTIGLAWLRAASGLAWHNGATFGFSNALVLEPRAATVTLLLANRMVPGLERSILRQAAGLPPGPRTPRGSLMRAHLVDLLRPVLRLIPR